MIKYLFLLLCLGLSFGLAAGSRAGTGLGGRILLAVEEKGEAWYVSPDHNYRYYLGRPADAYQLMRELGLGITSADLAKLPVGILSARADDADGDGLPDAVEDAIGTDRNEADSDRDGYPDGQEIKSGYDPAGPARAAYLPELAGRLAGRILLDVEKRGEAWYVNPVDRKRYFLGRPDFAFAVMRELGLGITSADLGRIIALTPSYNIVRLEERIHALVNEARAREGLAALHNDPELKAVARAHSRDLAEENARLTDLGASCDFPMIHHEGFVFGRYNRDRLMSRGYRSFSQTGENIALVSGAVVKVFYRSSGEARKLIDTCQTRRERVEKDFSGRLAELNDQDAKADFVRQEAEARRRLMAGEEKVDISEIEWRPEEAVAEATVSGWLESPGHRQNILTSAYDRAGIGVAYMNGYVITTQVFVKKADCGYWGGPCCEEAGYYPYCYEPYECRALVCGE